MFVQFQAPASHGKGANHVTAPNSHGLRAHFEWKIYSPVAVGEFISLGRSMTKQREGWLGDEYVRIYSATDRPRIAELYDFPTSLPGYEPWGSWGLDALCLGPDSRLYAVDWVPLDESFRREKYISIAAFEEAIARLHEATPAYEHYQKEVHLVHPLALGGDPKAAPIMIDQATHAKACRFFNKVYARMKNENAQ